MATIIIIYISNNKSNSKDSRISCRKTRILYMSDNRQIHKSDIQIADIGRQNERRESTAPIWIKGNRKNVLHQ